MELFYKAVVQVRVDVTVEKDAGSVFQVRSMNFHRHRQVILLKHDYKERLSRNDHRGDPRCVGNSGKKGNIQSSV